MNGIDVSYFQGRIDWAGAAAEGVEFAMIKASQGRLLKDPDSGPFADPRFSENILAAAAAGIAVGVYHYLCAGTVEEALAEASFFLNTITPYKQNIRLWAVCDAEEDRFLPKDRVACGDVVRTFLEKVRAAGFKPMLYSNPNYLTYRLPDMSRYDLWLAYWGTTEARPLAYNPKIWQYGVGRIANMTEVDVNRGYFTLDRDDTEENGVFEDHPRDDDGVLVSGGDSRGDPVVGGSSGGRVRPAGRPAFVHRGTDEQWRRVVHDKVGGGKSGKDPENRHTMEKR